MEDANVQAAAALEVTAVAEVASVKIRSYFSITQLATAERLAKLASDREAEVVASGVSLPVGDEEARGWVVAAVMLSVTFLESAINEMYQDAFDRKPGAVDGLDLDVIRKVGSVWAVVPHQTQALSRYDAALRLADREPYDKGRGLYQRTALLTRLRNFFTHYKPSDVGTDDVHELADPLRAQGFASSTTMVGAGNAWFPDHALSAGLAAWAVATAREFVSDFADRMGVRLPFQQAADSA